MHLVPYFLRRVVVFFLLREGPFFRTKKSTEGPFFRTKKSTECFVKRGPEKKRFENI